MLPFKDIEDLLRTFSGDDGQNFNRWLEVFEETSEICRWMEPQKIIYLKKLLRGSAKVYISYEKHFKTWGKLKKSLISEFGKTVNAKKVHQEFTCAKKKDSETIKTITI